MSRLQRLPQHFQYFAIKLGKLVQKQYAVMGEGDFAGLRFRAAADQCRAGSRVMGLPERALWPVTQGDATDHRLDGRDFQCFALGQRWQQAWQTAREQRLPRPRRSAE